MRSRQNGIGFGRALTVLAGLAVFASASEWGSGSMFARWSPHDEITSLRTENSKTFDNHDGTRSVVIAGALSPVAMPVDVDSTKQVGSESDNWPCIWYIGANYFRCQHLYLDSELNFNGYITRLAFYSDSADTDMLNQSQQWLQDVPDSLFSVPDTWLTGGTEVWDGSLVRSDTGWNELQIAPFLHCRGANLLVSYQHRDGSAENLDKCYRASYQGTSPIRAHWGTSSSNQNPPLQQKAWRANILITYRPFSETTDVATIAILAPTDTVLWQQPCVPRALVRNNGISPVNFPVQFRIGDGYANSVNVYGLSPGAQDTIGFPAWIPNSAGYLAVRCSTLLAGDQHPENNRLTDTVFVVRHDVGVSRILAPTGIIGPGDSALPEVVVRNYGTADEQPWVSVVIRNDSAVVYRDSVQIPVARGDSVLASLARYWRADTHRVSHVQAWTFGSPDMNPANDTACDSVVVGSLADDVGVVAISAPATLVDSGATVSPCARIRNLGASTVTGLAHFAISGAPPYIGDTVFVDLAPGAEQDVRFPSWVANRCGIYTARCSLGPDDNPGNDTLSIRFEVEAPSPWHRMADVPAGARHKAVRGGAALASSDANLVYALKGNRTREFYAYNVADNAWSALCSVPGRHARRASALCFAPGGGRVYAARAGSGEFWSYRPDDNTWHQRAEIPSGISGRKPSPGLALATMDTGRVYLLKGATREFLAYDAPHDTWLTLADAPAGISGRGYYTGSCLVAVRDYLYLLKDGRNEFYAYSILDDTWYNRTPLPATGPGAGRKAARSGTAIAHDRDIVYVLKGGKCGDLWWYDTFGDSWVAQRSLPPGPGLRPVADGGALAFAADRLWALKGNNTREFWAYQPQTADRYPLSATRSKEIRSQSPVRTSQFAVQVVPNPFTRSATVFCSLPAPVELNLQLYDVNGRLVRTLCSGKRPAGISSVRITESLAPGVYLLRFSTSTQSMTRQLVRQ